MTWVREHHPVAIEIMERDWFRAWSAWHGVLVWGGFASMFIAAPALVLFLKATFAAWTVAALVFVTGLFGAALSYWTDKKIRERFINQAIESGASEDAADKMFYQIWYE